MSQHLTWEELVDYWAGDGGDPDRIDEHLFACEACSEMSSHIAAITETMRSEIPTVLTPAGLEALVRKGLRIENNLMQPGERREVTFRKGVDLLLHRLAVDLSQATRVHFTIHAEGSGQVIVDLPDAPFDAGAGEILVACQRHFAIFPPDNVAEVTVEGPAPAVHRYTILHRYEARA